MFIQNNTMTNTRVAPKKAKHLYARALDNDLYISFSNPDIVCDPFDLASFYPSDFFVTISCANQKDNMMVCIEVKRSSSVEIDLLRDSSPDGNVAEHNAIFVISECVSKEDNKIKVIKVIDEDESLAECINIAFEHIFDNLDKFEN